jgi:hypothetical protein
MGGTRKKTTKQPVKPDETKLEKAVPPPDDPLLRHQADQLGHGVPGDAREAALARAKAVRQAQGMPEPEEPDDDPGDDDKD